MKSLNFTLFFLFVSNFCFSQCPFVSGPYSCDLEICFDVTSQLPECEDGGSFSLVGNYGIVGSAGSGTNIIIDNSMINGVTSFCFPVAMPGDVAIILRLVDCNGSLVMPSCISEGTIINVDDIDVPEYIISCTSWGFCVTDLNGNLVSETLINGQTPFISWSNPDYGTDQCVPALLDAGTPLVFDIFYNNRRCSETFELEMPDCRSGFIENPILERSLTDGDLSKYELSPNPASDFIKIETETPENVNFNIFSVSGSLVASGSIEDYTKFIDINGLETGVYIVTLSNQNLNFNQNLKFVKQ